MRAPDMYRLVRRAEGKHPTLQYLAWMASAIQRGIRFGFNRRASLRAYLGGSR